MLTKSKIIKKITNHVISELISTAVVLIQKAAYIENNIFKKITLMLFW